MNAGPAPWPRRDVGPARGTVQCMYLVFGDFRELRLEPSRSRHHVAAVDPAIEISVHGREDDPDWFDAWLQPPLGLELDELLPGVEVGRHGQLLRIQVQREAPADLDYLRDLCGLVSAATEPNGLAVLNVLAAQWWRPRDWRSNFIDRSEFAVHDHVRNFMSLDPSVGPGMWLHTRGMQQFGQPDLQIREVPEDDAHLQALAGGLLQQIAENLALGMKFEDGQVLELEPLRAKIRLRAMEEADSGPAAVIGNASWLLCDADGGGDGLELVLREFLEMSRPGN